MCQVSILRSLLSFLLAGMHALSQSTGSSATHDCYSTDQNGARVEMGETICLNGDGQVVMAQYLMSLDNPTWRKVSDGCLSPGVKLPQPAVDAVGVDAHI